MIPKKAETLVPEVAKELNIDEKLVADLINYTWKKLRKHLVNCDYHNIYVESLGTFCAKSWRVEEAIDKYTGIIKSYQDIIDRGERINYQKFGQMKYAQASLEKMQKLKSQIQDDLVKKESVKKLRNGKSTEKSVAQQEENS